MSNIAFSQKEIYNSEMSAKKFLELAEQFNWIIKESEYGYKIEIKGKNRAILHADKTGKSKVFRFELHHSEGTQMIHSKMVRNYILMYTDWNDPTLDYIENK